MKRRQFIQTAAGGLAAATLASSLAESAPRKGAYDLVAAKGGSPVAMYDKAIAAIGGMGKYVKKGQTVVVKPNIGWDVEPERAACTNPQLVGRIVKNCYEAGAKKVYVFDHTCDDWKSCYSKSGVESAAKNAGAEVVSGASEGYYQKIDIKNGKSLKDAKVHELILESDVFINVPILKSHGSTKLTIAMKNLMGIVWDRRYWHRNDLHQCISDFMTYRKPDLNIVDAYRILKRNGPRGVSKADVASAKSLLISEDAVAVDAASAKIFGFDPSEVAYIKHGDKMKIGTMDLGKLSIKRINV